jgi:glycosyltransferase involved in cell wall biosynthesis
VVTSSATVGTASVAASEARRAEAPRLARIGGSAAADAAAGAGRPLRVVHCLDGFGVGGTELNAVRTLERLDRARFDLTLVSLTADGPLRERVERAGIPVRPTPLRNMYGPAALRSAAGLALWLRRERVDVVHCHDLYTNIFAAGCARLAGVPLIIASRRWWQAIPGRLHAEGNRLSYRHVAHRVLANSAAVGRRLVEEGVPASKIVVVPNFLDDAAFDPLPEAARRAALAGFGVPADALVVGAVAMLRPEKDLVSLVRAVALLAPAHPRLHLLLVGGGACEGELRAAARELGVADRVHLAGYQPGVPNPHQYLDVSVLCSLHEGFPNAIIEAMAAARPVVATEVGGVPDAVAHEATGLLVAPGAPAELAAAIGRLADDPALRSRFGAAGRERALADYRADAVLDALSRLYLTATAGRRR